MASMSALRRRSQDFSSLRTQKIVAILPRAGVPLACLKRLELREGASSPNRLAGFLGQKGGLAAGAWRPLAWFSPFCFGVV